MQKNEFVFAFCVLLEQLLELILRRYLKDYFIQKKTNFDSVWMSFEKFQGQLLICSQLMSHFKTILNSILDSI